MDCIFDSHAHYDDHAFDSDRPELLRRLPDEGIVGVINCASDIPSAKACIALSQQYQYIYAAVGVHPHECKSAGTYQESLLTSLLKQDKVVAVGEIGLDYHYDFSPRSLQIEWFDRQLALAVQLDLPVIVHDREAHADTLSLLQKHRPKGVVHCFSGSVEMAREIVDLGMYIGLGGAVTFKNAVRPLAVAQAIPLDRLLLETDAPYMAPVPLRGKRCDSSMIKFTAEKIAQLRGTTSAEIYRAGYENACRLFGIHMEEPDT